MSKNLSIFSKALSTLCTKHFFVQYPFFCIKHVSNTFFRAYNLAGFFKYFTLISTNQSFWIFVSVACCSDVLIRMEIDAILGLHRLFPDIIYVYTSNKYHYRLFIIMANNNHIKSRLHDSIQLRWLNVTQVFVRSVDLSFSTCTKIANYWK